MTTTTGTWLLAPLLLLLLLGPVSASDIFARQDGDDGTLVQTTAAFIDAVENASTDPMNPSVINVYFIATIDFDEIGSSVDPVGLRLDNKYFHAKCIGYTEDRKCLVERSVHGGQNGGRFFVGYEDAPWDGSFTGFEFKGGVVPVMTPTSLVATAGRGGAFALYGGRSVASANTAFTDCIFFNNTSVDGYFGGAFFYRSDGETSSLSFTRCIFDPNTGSMGGAIYFVRDYAGMAKLAISQSMFLNNDGGDDGNDIKGESMRRGNGELIFSCSETTTSGTVNDVRVMGASQTCSVSAVPSAAPSTSFAPSVSALPSSAPSVSALPSSAPSAFPSASALPSSSPSASPSASALPSSSPSASAQPSIVPSAQPSIVPSDQPSSAPSPEWQRLTYDNFEGGWGNFEKGKSGSNRAQRFQGDIDDGVPTGNYCRRIRGDRGNKSSVKLDHFIDVSQYEKLNLSFKYRTKGLEKVNDILFVEWTWKGNTKGWKELKTYGFLPYKKSKRTYTNSFDIVKDFATKSKIKIRFRSDAADNDHFFIDNVELKAYLGNDP